MINDEEMQAALAAVAQGFLEEARELLAEFERLLLALEDMGDSPDQINAIFRAMHSIKGTAGMFGLDAIVEFTHVVETCLTKLRNGEVKPSADLIALLLQCGDHTSSLVELAGQGIAQPPEDLRTRGTELHADLGKYISGATPSAAPSATPVAAPAAIATAVSHAKPPLTHDGKDPIQIDAWHISLRFGRELLKQGMDPLPFIAYLNNLGKIIRVTLVPDGIPALGEMDAEHCYLGFEIDFQGDITQDDIRSVFDFVKEDSSIRVLPPKSKISEYVRLINELPEDNARVGEILLASGTISYADLQAALSVQEFRADGQMLGKVLIEEKMAHPEVVAAAVQKQEASRKHSIQTPPPSAANKEGGGSVRVDAEKLDKLINTVGELVIAGAGAHLLARKHGAEDVIESLSVVGRLVQEIRDNALGLRMVEIGATFDRFKRVVRDVSRELNKQIDLVISGGETELDKFVVEQLADPLMHLVRNSMDHGIEAAETRKSRGKTEAGHIYLNAYHDSGTIVIEVGDDGGGLNRDKILKKAIEKNLARADQKLTDQEIYRLIFEPGFSTADTVTNLSGRGVGMDVVKSKIETLRGSVDVDSELGKGATFILRLPLTLAIIDGFLVRVANDVYIIPLDMVSECVELPFKVDTENFTPHYINLHGAVLPFVRLRELFQDNSDTPRRESIVVVRYAGQVAGIVVDELLGEYQTVIKPLNKLFQGLRWISGSTILGSGQVGLILDVQALVQAAMTRDSSRMQTLPKSA
jgi:two-component system, chemotaxis family, sensor kinase CheA